MTVLMLYPKAMVTPSFTGDVTLLRGPADPTLFSK